MAQRELRELKGSIKDVHPVSELVGVAKTVEQVKSKKTTLDNSIKFWGVFFFPLPPQAKAIMTFIESITEKTLRSTVVLTAARGRGKSAALGVAMAAAVAFG
jgi:N-acetyltransferase 10